MLYEGIGPSFLAIRSVGREKITTNQGNKGCDGSVGYCCNENIEEQPSEGRKEHKRKKTGATKPSWLNPILSNGIRLIGAEYNQSENKPNFIPFSAFWLRSSVVSVLISLISDMRLIEPHDINLIFLGCESVW